MIGFGRILRAELARTRRSAAAVLPWAGVLIGLTSTASGAFVTPENGSRAALLWQALYVTGMAGGLLSLLAGLTAARESAARQGGTPCRPVDPRHVVLSRSIVLAGLSALFHALVFWSVVPLSVAFGVPVDVGTALWAGVVCWAATLGVLLLAFVAAERFGTVAVFLVGCGWQLVGTLTAESPLWTLVPPAWAVRAMLPLLGIHQNAEPLDPRDPLANESPWLALGLGAGLVVVVLVVRLAVRPPRGESGRTSGAGRVGRRSTRPGALPAIGAAMRERPVLPLCTAAVALCVVTAATYPIDYLLGLHTFALLPMGGCVVAVLLWQTLAPTWRLLMARRPDLAPAVPLWLVGCVTAVTLTVAVVIVLGAVLRSDWVDAAAAVGLLRTIVLWLLVGAAAALGSLWLSVRAGIGWALGVVVGLTVSGATIGGDVLAHTWLWVLGPTGWPLSADSPARFAFACSLGLAGTVAGWILSRRALREAPARGV